jgi:hypothetical protein
LPSVEIRAENRTRGVAAEIRIVAEPLLGLTA